MNFKETIIFKDFKEFDQIDLVNFSQQANISLLKIEELKQRKMFIDFAILHFQMAKFEKRLFSKNMTTTILDKLLTQFASEFNATFDSVKNEIFQLNETTTNKLGKNKQTNYSYKTGNSPENQGQYLENGTETDAVENSQTTVRDQYDATAMKEQGDFFKLYINRFKILLYGIV